MSTRRPAPDPESLHSRRPTQPPQGDASLGELILAGAIHKKPGPIVRAEDQRDGNSYESAQSIAEVLVYRYLTDRSFFELERHLKQSPRICHYFGLKEARNHTTWAKYAKEQFSEGTLARLKQYATWIQDDLADLNTPEVEPYLPEESNEPTTAATTERVTDGQKRQTVRNVWGLIADDFDFARGPGIEWSTKYLYDVFAEGAGKGSRPTKSSTKDARTPRTRA